MAHYREALVQNPQYAEAYNNLGEALAGSGGSKDAIAQFEKAVQIDAGYDIARRNLATLLARTGQIDKAIVHLDKLVERKPDAADIRRDLGHALVDKRRFQQASLQLEEANKLSGGRDPITLHLLGRAYADLGRRTDALTAQRQALALANEPTLLREISAQLAQLQGSP
jgi:superkiller protein 3